MPRVNIYLYEDGKVVNSVVVNRNKVVCRRKVKKATGEVERLIKFHEDRGEKVITYSIEGNITCIQFVDDPKVVIS